MAIYHPPSFINRYIQEKIAIDNNFAVPMYPTMPTDPNIAYDFTIHDLTEGGPFLAPFSFGGSLAIYDRMLKMRRTPFPHIKSEQLLYYFYAIEADAAETLIELTQKIQDELDSEDESAQKINAFVNAYQAQNPGPDIVEDDKTYKTAMFGDKAVRLPFFHRIRIYQLEETRDIIDFGTARTYAGNKIIIDYDWHKS